MSITNHSKRPHLPIAFWKTTAVVFECLSIYAFAVAWNCDAILPGMRLAGAVCGYIALDALFRSHKFRQIAWKFPASRPPLAASLVVVFVIAVLASVIVPVTTRCNDENVKQQMALSKLKQDGLALVMYMQDNNYYVPTMRNTVDLRKALSRYNDSGVGLIDPISDRPFAWQESLSGIDLNFVDEPDSVIVAYSPTPFKKGESYSRAVLFLDGHVRCYQELEFWQRMDKQPRLLVKAWKQKEKAAQKTILLPKK